MNPYCQCDSPGMCSRHLIVKRKREMELCKGTANTPDCGLKYWNAWEAGKMGANVPAEPQPNPEGFCTTQRKMTTRPSRTIKDPRDFPVKIGTILANKIARLADVTKTSGCQCQSLQDEMDLKGLSWVEEYRPAIVQQLVTNRNVLMEALKNSKEDIHRIIGYVGGYVPDFVLRAGAEWLLEEAISEARVMLSVIPMTVMKTTAVQNRLFERCISASPPEPDPIDSPVFHLGFHLYPVKGNWEWHGQRWKELLSLLGNRAGVKRIGVSLDSTTDTEETVRQYFGNQFDLTFQPNTAVGENPTFLDLQQTVPNGQDDILLYAHSKGVRQHTFDSQAVRLWTEMMYETVLFNYEAVAARMSEGYKLFGSFRTFGNYHLLPRYRWHYSGTFMAVRAKYLRDREVKNAYGGVEVWPGQHFRAEECWNEFADNRPLMAQYHLSHMYPTVVDAQMQWESDRISTTRIEQHRREFEWFLKFIRPKSRILIIGSRQGGMEEQILKRYPQAVTISVDTNPLPNNRAPNLIVGNSQHKDVRSRVQELGPYDVVFIDGDHSYLGAQADWMFATSLTPRIIAFHDIAQAIKHREEGCQVPRLWSDIRERFSTQEFSVGCGWGGIGVVQNLQ